MTAATSLETAPDAGGQPPFVLLKRPLLLVATFLIPGIVLGHFVHLRALSLFHALPLFLLLLLAVVLLARHSTFSTPVSMLCVSWVGFLLGAKTNLLPPNHVHFGMSEEEPYELVGVVVEEPAPLRSGSWARPSPQQSTGRCRFTVEASRLRNPESARWLWQDATGKVQVYASGKEAGQLKYGDRVELAGTAFLPEQRRNPGGFDMQKYLAQEGIYVCLRADEVSRVEPGHGNPVYTWVHSLKEKLRRSLSAGKVAPDTSPFLRAIILGERREVDEDFKEALRRTNTMHILAISGLNVVILAFPIYFLLSRLLLVPKTVSSLATIVAVAGYSLLTGMYPPVFRSFVMCTVLLLGPILKRRSDSLNSLAAAAVVILCIRPGDLFTAGFQLSFMVVLSIILLADKMLQLFIQLFDLRPDPGFLTVGRWQRRVYRKLEYPVRLLSVSLAAFVGSLPLILHYFHFVSFLSPLCNVGVVSLVGFIVPFGLLAGVLGLVSLPVAGAINAANGGLISALRGVVEFFTTRIGSVNVSPPPLAFLFVFWCGLCVVGFGRTLRRVAVPAAALGVVTLGVFVGGEMARRHPGSIEVTFLDVGQGDCAFVEFPDGRRMLVDGGSATKSEVGRYVIVPFLRWSGVNRLDALVVTHYDTDHVNALTDVLRDIRTRLVILRAGPPVPDAPEANDLLKLAETRRIPLQVTQAGELLPVSTKTESLVLNPPREGDLSSFSENDLSVVLKLDYGGASVLLSGDIEAKVERRILREGVPVQSEVVKVPHHGSNSSSSEEFLRSVRPKVAVVSCGRGNIYGHPAAMVVDRYEGLGARLFRTDRDGAIVVRVFPNRLAVTTEL
ncbi:MAG: DNA internalization-related competence protein ComEC/Rec2 [bacterium]|nr:DNA internalization-related competence protein ComEC/Rec2 [bacterium]